MSVATCVSTGSQTLWTFPPFDIVDNCPLPSPLFSSNFMLGMPKKLQTLLMNRYAIDEQDAAASRLSTNPPATSMSYNQQTSALQPPSNVQLDAYSSPTSCSFIPSLDIKKRRLDDCPDESVLEPDSSQDMVSSSTRPVEKMAADVSVSKPSRSSKDLLKERCQICGDAAAGFHCGAYVCEACKKFYVRASKQPNRTYTCTNRNASAKNSCVIRKTNRTSCSYCRFRRCLDVGMEPPGKGLLDTHSVKFLPCKVCGSPSSGYHFGVLTCEGCKGFYRRLIQDGSTKADSLVCQASGDCDVDILSRSQCRACRYHKCLAVGMSRDAARIGRQPNSVRYARIIENRVAKTEVVDVDDPASQTSSACALSASEDVPSFITKSSTQYIPTQDSQSILPKPSTVPQIQRSDHPIDLSMSCSLDVDIPMSSPLDLSPRLMSAETSVRRIEGLAVLFHRTCQDYYRVDDGELLFPDVEDIRFAQLVYEQFQRCLREHINFSKNLSGFMQLQIEDRILLTKCSLYRFVLLAASQRYDLQTGRHYMFGWKSWGSAPARLVTMYPEYKILRYHFDVLGRQIKEINCSPEELGILNAINIINKDTLSDLKDTEALVRLSDDYMELLVFNTKAKHADPAKRLQELNHILHLCKQSAKEHAGAARTVINKYPSYAALAAQNAEIIPQLYKEMYTSTPWEHGKMS